MRWLSKTDLLVATIPRKEIFRQVGWLSPAGKFYALVQLTAAYGEQVEQFIPVYIHLESEEMQDVISSL